ncbi:MAG: bifunctional phosphoribosyl-AMP cyclohydrolase/phosphoribosyl-ATP diphosphatase HisIE [Sphingomonadales bacterium]
MTNQLIAEVDWQKGDGLVPAIVQDVLSCDVLMLGFMNHEALARTLKTNRVTFWSRTRKCLWEKGETSGNYLELKTIRLDCDQDTLLIEARPRGKTCHLGTKTCFGEGDDGLSWLLVLQGIIRERKEQKDPQSYTWSLLENGPEKAAKKLGEEGVELALAAVSGDKDHIKEEAADVLYHLLVVLEASGVSLQDVLKVLKAREK